MEKIEIDYQLKTPSNELVKVKVLAGAYSVIIITLSSSLIGNTTTLNNMIHDLAEIYKLDKARLVVIGHATPQPIRIAYDTLEWVYYDFKYGKDLKPIIGNSSIRKLDVNLLYALLERSGWAEEMVQLSKPITILLQSLPDGSREISVLYNDDKIEMKATVAASVGVDKAREIAQAISSEVGVTQIKEEPVK